jgi:rhodanese-related sulfurtransferase
MVQLRPNQVADWARQQLAAVPGEKPVLLDVREPWEIQLASLQPSPDWEFMAMPMRAIPARYPELDRERPVICMCHHGVRSMQVAHFLAQQGFQNIANVVGGINAWAMEFDPSVPVY